MDSMTIIRLWAASAWADGKLHKAEASALERLIEASEDLSVEQRKEVRGLLTSAPSVDLSEVRSLPPESREGVYRAATRIVKLDREVTADEEEFLARLRAELELDEATIARIDAGY